MRQAQVTKQKILDAAELCFSKKGLYGARVDEISAVAGVNKRMIYAYFGSKEKLYIAVLETVYAKMAAQEQRLLTQRADCVTTLKKIIRHFFKFLQENPNFVKMVMWENLNEAEYLKQSKARVTKGIGTTLLKNVLEKGIQQEIFRPELDVQEMIFSINMFCFSYFSNIYTMAEIMQNEYAEETQIEKRITHITDMILRYVLKEEE